MLEIFIKLLCERIEKLEKRLQEDEKKIADLEAKVQSQQEADLDGLVKHISDQITNSLAEYPPVINLL